MIKSSKITADAAISPNPVDRILLSMNNMYVLPLIENSLEERITDNARITCYLWLLRQR